MTRVTVAAVQMVSGRELEANLAQARDLIRRAAEAGAQLVVLPENFPMFATSQLRSVAENEWLGGDSEDGPGVAFLREQAARHGVWLVGGTLPLCRRPGAQGALVTDEAVAAERVRAGCLVVDDGGRVRARYDKIHLFDAAVNDAHGRYSESDYIEPGEQLVTVDTPWGRLGLSVCYDLRFAELYYALSRAGAEMVAVPSAFTAATGAAHWEVLLRARAIENQLFVIGADQGGWHDEHRHTFGHSMIVEPWGEILAVRREEGPGVVVSELDLERRRQLMAQMPVHQHHRFSVDGPHEAPQ